MREKSQACLDSSECEQPRTKFNVQTSGDRNTSSGKHQREGLTGVVWKSGRSRRGERYGQTGRKAVPPREKEGSPEVRSGRGKHSQRTGKTFAAAAANIRSGRCEPFFTLWAYSGNGSRTPNDSETGIWFMKRP